MSATIKMIVIGRDGVDLVLFGAAIKGFDCRGASIWGGVGVCCFLGGSSWAFSLHSSAPSVALDIHLEDCCVMHKPVDGG